MTATTTARLTTAGSPLPSMGTIPMAANTLILKGTIVSLNASGYAVPATDGDGFPAMGRANATYDNRTGSEAGGLAGDLDCEVEYGVFAFDISGDAPSPGDLMFTVDNQTVSADSDSSARGVAGYCCEVRAENGRNQAFVWFGPHVTGQVEAIDLAAAEAAIADLEADVAELFIPVPIGMTPVFADGSANGLDPTVCGFRLNNAVDDQPFRAVVPLPADLDTSADLLVKTQAYIIDDATDDDVVLVLLAKIDGGSDVAPVSATVLGESAAEITFTIPAASVPSGAKSLYLELDAAATLDTSDAVIESIEVTGTRTIASA